MVVKILFYNSDESVNVLEVKEFQNAKNRFDSELSDWAYQTVLKYDRKYNFADYENAPNMAIRYNDNLGNVVYEESLVEFVMNL